MSFAIGKKTQIKNMIFAYLPYFAQIISTIILTPIYVNTFGAEKYAIFVILHSIIGYFMLSNIGLPQAFTRQIIHLKEKNETQKINDILNSILFYYSLVIFAVLGINSVLFYGNLFGISGFLLNSQNEEFIHIFGLGMFLVSIKFAINLTTDIFQSLIDSTNRLDISNFIRFLQVSLLAVGSFIALKIFATIEAVIISNIITSAFVFIVMIIFSKKSFDFKIDLSSAKLAHFKDILPSSFWYFMGAITVAIITQIDTLVISTILGLSFVTVYSLMFKFSEVFRNLISTAVNVFFTQIAYKHSKNELQDISKQFNKFFMIIACLAFCVGFLLYFIGYDLFVLWIGKQNAGSIDLFFWFVLYLILFSINQVATLFINAINKHKSIVMVGFVQAALNLILSITTLQIFADIKWVIISTIISLLLTNFWYNIFYFKKTIKCM